MPEPLHVALVGLRGINEWFYRPALLRSAKAKLVAGIDPAEEARGKFAAPNDVPTYASLAEALERHRLEAVIIGSPNHIHLQNIQEAAAAGMHMCVTKPLANSVSQCNQAIQIAQRANVVLQVGQEFRFRPGVCRAIRLAHDQAFGPVTLAIAHMGHAGGLNPKLTGPATWRNNAANCPGGCANMVGIHLFDACNALFGVPRRVTASLRRIHAPVAMEDTAAIIIEYDQGTAICTCSYVSPQSETLRLHAVQANLLADERRLMIETSDGTEPADLSSAPLAADVLIDQLYNAVRLGIAPQTTGAEGRLAVAVLEAAIHSSLQRRAVDLDEILADGITAQPAL